jgi:NitT/TauT family transport system substrate-binding protein
MRFRIGGVLALSTILCSALMTSPLTAAETLRVRLDWSPWGDQAPFHLALRKGLFAKHGLDVQLDDGNGSVATVQIVGNSSDYDIGHASLSSMAIARSKGLAVKAFAGFIRVNDIGLIVAADGGINGPADLKGKKLAFTAGSLETPFLDSFLAAGGLKRTDVELTNVDAAAKAGIYMVGRVDGTFSSGPFMLPVVNQQRASKVLRFADYNLEFPSFGLLAREATFTAKREALRTFASIVAGEWEYIFKGHEDEAVQAIIADRPQAKLNPDVLRAQIDTLRGYVSTAATKDKSMGIMADSDWQKALTTLKQGGLIDHLDPPSFFYTNDFIDEKLVADVANGAS